MRQLGFALILVSGAFHGAAHAQEAAKRPNILVMFGDDIGYWNVSAYNRGMMGYRRPTSTASPRKGRSSPTPTPSRAARRVARRSSPASHPSAPAC